MGPGTSSKCAWSKPQDPGGLSFGLPGWNRDAPCQSAREYPAIVLLAQHVYQTIKNIDVSLSLGQELIVDQCLAVRIETSVLKGLGVVLDFEFLTLLERRQRRILIQRLRRV